ncbi:succinate dehydrogenase cytochrome B558 [Kurthia zopfii]|uniref:Succinate dehydrogenase cytochrome b558 subunit n=1 Tax=Kurthia zopfii TaxID=1650 RepID=A0A2U3AER3_9BACL|nr:succinate dehydrogenase cytochrome b558 subunit [Kurthia zopfii]PWI23036.1 succinate dehydrogenase [Kurthia zopfii]TDR40496.1 succinate dehydrogenase subunit C [Kurthia zopfii]STX10235.1 Succinate dehydrogenase cytochrome b558 subunit [Kurthia zopfii]VEI08150.1 Succinate dehydrogenase cytochrome b558 subunit [Kurthia zopfii]GEK30055.1 succinate dehydrogenase cytochrome B558 [Kurthia zopfii]
MSKDREFYWRRLHSLLGLIPVGLFVTMHLLINYSATNGEESFNKASGLMESIPFLPIVEWVVIYIPLMFHALYGVYIAFTAKPNLNRFGTTRNWFFMMQRVTGIFLVIFIAWHIFQTRLQKTINDVEIDYNLVADIVSNPGMLAFYIAGIIATTFHLANGIWSFLVSWGLIQSPKSQKVTTYITMIFFVLLSVVGVMAILAFV